MVIRTLTGFLRSPILPLCHVKHPAPKAPVPDAEGQLRGVVELPEGPEFVKHVVEALEGD